MIISEPKHLTHQLSHAFVVSPVRFRMLFYLYCYTSQVNKRSINTLEKPMFRHYYITDDLGDLEQVERELVDNGLTVPQFHVLSENDAELEKHHLHAIESVLKKDVVHSTQLGAVIGIIGAFLILLVAYIFNWHMTAVGWIPFGFCAVVVLGFCTWEGGLIGIQTPNYQFKRFQQLLGQGMHVFFVDITAEQESVLQEVTSQHPSLRYAGAGEATPSWVVNGQHKFNQAMKAMP
tara:strand:+ start:6507 stop:7208 length:702 start_codon:yes stop_codon:yes gene_type:complete